MEIKFTAKKYVEEDNSITLSLREIDIIENGKNEEEAKRKLAEAILEYAEDFKFFSFGKNRESHASIVAEIKNLTTDNIEERIKID